MKKIVSLVMAVVMCLSIAVVGTASASAKSINYEGIYLKIHQTGVIKQDKGFVNGKIYKTDDVFALALLSNIRVPNKSKHVKRISINDKNLKISSNNAIFSKNKKYFVFKNYTTNQSTKIKFTYKYNKKTFTKTIEPMVWNKIRSFSKGETNLLEELIYREVGNSRNKKLIRSVISCYCNLYDELSYKKAIIAIKKPTNKNISNSKYFDFYKYVKTVLKKNIKIKKYKDNYNITENIILIKKNPKKFRIKNIKYIARGNYASYTTPVYRIGNIYFSK